MYQISLRFISVSSCCNRSHGVSSNIFHPGAPPIPTAAAFRVCHELSCTRRSAGSKERCCRGGNFCIFVLGEFGVVIKGWCRREKLHPSPLGGVFYWYLNIISLVFQPLGMFGSSCFSLHQVALQRLEEQRVELEREIQEAKDALEKLRTEAAAVEHSLLRQHWNVVSHFVCKVCIDGQMLPNLARLLGNWWYWSEVNYFKLLKDYSTIQVGSPGFQLTNHNNIENMKGFQLLLSPLVAHHDAPLLHQCHSEVGVCVLRSWWSYQRRAKRSKSPWRRSWNV